MRHLTLVGNLGTNVLLFDIGNTNNHSLTFGGLQRGYRPRAQIPSAPPQHSPKLAEFGVSQASYSAAIASGNEIA